MKVHQLTVRGNQRLSISTPKMKFLRGQRMVTNQNFPPANLLDSPMFCMYMTIRPHFTFCWQDYYSQLFGAKTINSNSIAQALCLPVSVTELLGANQSNNVRLLDTSTNQPIDWPTDQPINQSIYQASKQAIDQSINPLVSQSIN